MTLGVKRLIFLCITPRRCIRERAQYILTLNTRQTFRNSHTMVSNRSKKMQVGTVHVSKQWWGSCVMPLSDTERRVDIESLHKRLSVSQGAGKSLARPGRETSSEACQGRARFQQHRDASCHQVFFFPASQGAEGNSRHSDRNISFFPSWSG